VREISVLMPADAAQAKLAAQIVVYRETADDTLDRANVPGLTVEQVCRVRRAAADLTRTSATLERALSRRQEQPAPFFGTVLSDQVDIAALDAVWCKGARADRPGAAAVPQPAAPDTVASEPAAAARAAAETGPPQPPAGIALAGLEPVGLAMARIAATGRVPVGFEPVELVPVGFEPVESVPVELDPAGLDPAGLRPGSERAPQATPVSDPTVRTMAGLPGGSAAPMHDGRMEARAA
jgi:hypothetical protein